MTIIASRMTAKASWPTGLARRDVVGAIERTFVDLGARHARVDFDLDRVEFVILIMRYEPLAYS
jgi:hypothetical protein